MKSSLLNCTMKWQVLPFDSLIKMDTFILIFFLFITSPFFSCKSSLASDSLSQNQVLPDNGDTLVSAGAKFELGFFSPPLMKTRYIGIWFKNIPEQTVVWVANKDSPLMNSSGVLTVNPSGNLVILDSTTDATIWSATANASTVSSSGLVLQLLDNGNLVLKNGDGYLWQSFDYPCDTLLAGMKLGWDFRNNKEWYLTSWKSFQDPGTGSYKLRDDPEGLPQVLLFQGNSTVYRSGPWDGARFGSGALESNTVFKPEFVYTHENEYYSFENSDDSVISRFVLNQTGLIQHITWSIRRNQWVDIATVQSDNCDNYALCGDFGFCDVDKNPSCSCLPGFTPKIPKDWEGMDWSGGCAREKELNCSEPSGFRKFSGMKLPDSGQFPAGETGNDAFVCAEVCLKNCSCVAYAETKVSGCVVWYGHLIDLRTYNDGGQDLFIRMPASQLGSNTKMNKWMIVLSAGIFAILVFPLGWCLFSIWISKRKSADKQDIESYKNKKIGDEEIELPLFDLVTISKATNDFSSTNKLGEGGFGPVYKGVLPTGLEIAVKKDSRDSGQGVEEFKNEVILIAKLQHRNLVRLLGCCIHGEERMLVYEYMPNRSLDLFIFNQWRGKELIWRKRYNIIVGIARGLLYLHRDSRLRIIHRDLKLSNILLDGEMNPKISDFGLARTFGGDQCEDNTRRVMGTYGYMAPEYAVDGLFSTKSDIFSFGVLVLEIVSGEKNRGFCHPDHDLNLLGHAWKLWNEGNPLDFVDPCMEGSASTFEALRCIHVGLLCVQQRPNDRPTMSTVLTLLDSECPTLEQPKQPGFYVERTVCDSHSSSPGKLPPVSTEMTLTLLEGR